MLREVARNNVPSATIPASMGGMPRPIDAVIAENVRVARARQRISQQELADRLKWARPTVSALEAGTRRVTVEDAVLLCGVLGIELRDLLDGADEDAVRTLGL